MRAPAILLPVLLLTACGGGGTGGPPTPPVIPIDSNVVLALAPDYRAVFDVDARVRWSGVALPIDVTGTLVMENEGTQVAYPLDTARQGWELRNTITLVVPALLRAQNPNLPADVTVILREFVEVASSGAWYSLGGETEDPTTVPPTPYPSWWASPMLVQEPTMFPGQVIHQGPVNVLAEDLVTVRGTRQTARTVAATTEVLDTPLGSFECYRATVVETLTANQPAATPVVITYTRWERPDTGVLRMLAEGYEFSGEYQGTPYTINLDRLEATIRTLEP